MRHLSQDIHVNVEHRKVSKDVDETPLQEEGTDVDPEILDDETEVATESFGKVWKKFKIWFTEGNRSAVENIHVLFDFINEHAKDEDVARVCEGIRMEIPTKKELIQLNNTMLKILTAYGNEFTRIQKSGNFLKAYNSPADKGFDIPECTQFVGMWKTVGVDAIFDYGYKFLVILDYKEFNKKYMSDISRKLTKLEIKSIADLKELVNLIDSTDKFMNHFYGTVAKGMINTDRFPLAPKGLTMSRTEDDLARMNFFRALAIRNCSVDSFDIAHFVLSTIHQIFKKIKSDI